MIPRLLPATSAWKLVLRRKIYTFVNYKKMLMRSSYLDAAAFVKAKVNSAGLVVLGELLVAIVLAFSLIRFPLRMTGYTQALRSALKIPLRLIAILTSFILDPV